MPSRIVSGLGKSAEEFIDLSRLFGGEIGQPIPQTPLGLDRVQTGAVRPRTARPGRGHDIRSGLFANFHDEC